MPCKKTEPGMIAAASLAEAYARGRFDERHYAAALRDYHHWSNISAGPPVDPPNPYLPAREQYEKEQSGDTQED